MKKLILILFFYLSIITPKVLIITHAFNKPEFIEYQYRTFAKFLEDDYEYVVFNDAKTIKDDNAIKSVCAKFKIRCIRIPQDLHNEPYLAYDPEVLQKIIQQPGYRHVNGIHFALDILGLKYKGIVVLIDSDLFLLKPFSVQKYMAEYDLSAKLENRTIDSESYDYISPLLVFFKMQNLPNVEEIDFRGMKIGTVGFDNGGRMYFYMKKYPFIKVKFFDGEYIWRGKDIEQYKGFLPEQIIPTIKQGFNHFDILMSGHFLHYKCGTNWINFSQEFILKKEELIQEIIDCLVSM